MRIGYTGYNSALDATTARAFRLNAYSDERMAKIFDLNLSSLFDILRYNAEHELGLFSLPQGFIPYAGSDVITLDWVSTFGAHLDTAGNLVRTGDHRLYIFIPNLIINSPRSTVITSSTAELQAYADLFDAMHLDLTHRIAISIGGVFGDKKKSMRRFVDNFTALDERIRRRLALINDDNYTVRECLRVHRETGLPVVFDHFWHETNSGGDPFIDMFVQAQKTWADEMGCPIVVYMPTQGVRMDERPPRADWLQAGEFIAFYQQVRGFAFDLLIETTQYEAAARRALELTGKLRAA
jgi:UV DNA damage endonuclease